MKDYSEIENRLQKHYDGLLDAVKAPDTTKKPNNKKSSKWENIKDFFNSTGMQVAAAALALVCTVGGVYLFIFIFSGKNINLNPTTHETSTDTEVSADDPAAKTLQIVFSDMYGRESAKYGVCAGDSVSMRIDLKSVSDLASLSLTLSWDERLTLDYAEYETGFRLDGMHISAGDIELWNTENSCTLEWTASGNKNPKNGACMFVDLVFATPEYAASRFDITVTANTDKILDSKGQKIPVSTKNIFIETTERLLSEFVSSDEISDTEVPVSTEEITTEEDTTEPYDEWYATSTTDPETIPPDVFTTDEITTDVPKTDPQDDTEETEEIPAAETDPYDDTEETEEVPITETDKQDGKDIPEPLKIVLTSFDNREYSSYVGKLAGEAEYFKVFLKNVSNLSAISVTVSWDERLELFTAYNALRPDWYADDSVYELCRRNHSYTFEWSSDDPADAISGDLYFICISFSTPENVASSFNINFTVNTSGTYNTAGQNIPSSSKSIPIETVYKELEWPESVPETDPVTEPEKEPEKGREFKSVQSSHETPQELENPTNMYTSNPYNAHPGGGIYGGKASYIAFKVLDCGYEQFESIKAFQGQSLPSDTFDMREKLAAGKLKFWLCDLDGNKIDYVYANGNGIVAFEMYPGEYRITYEDDGIYKTNYSSIIRVYEAEGGGTYYMIYDSVDKVGDNAYVGIYNYQKYKPVTIRITDDITGEPLKGVNVGYQIQYLNDDIEYMKTDDYGQIKLNSIFDIMLYQNPGSVGSWHSDIMLYFEKDGYDRFGIKTDNVTETTLEVQLHKTEYFEYTVKVLDKETGEPIKGAKLEWNSSVNGEFIIDESGDDGILKGIMYSSSLSDLYGDTRVSPHVSVSYVCKTARYNYQAQKDVPLYKGVYDFTLLFTNVDTREPEGEFELVLSE